MTKFFDYSYRIFNNPFKLSPILISFYKDCSNVEKNFLLSYLVYPLCLQEEGQRILIQSKRTSGIERFSANNNILKISLLPKIKEYQKITNLSIQYCLDNKFLELRNMNLYPTEFTPPSIEILELQKPVLAARKLAVILNKYEIVHIFRMLGCSSL